MLTNNQPTNVLYSPITVTRIIASQHPRFFYRKFEIGRNGIGICAAASDMYLLHDATAHTSDMYLLHDATAHILC